MGLGVLLTTVALTNLARVAADERLGRARVHDVRVRVQVRPERRLAVHEVRVVEEAVQRRGPRLRHGEHAVAQVARAGPQARVAGPVPDRGNVREVLALVGLPSPALDEGRVAAARDGSSLYSTERMRPETSFCGYAGLPPTDGTINLRADVSGRSNSREVCVSDERSVTQREK